MILSATVYNVACDRCPVLHASGGGSPQSAREEAEEAGWCVADVALCPQCLAALATPRLRLRGTA